MHGLHGQLRSVCKIAGDDGAMDEIERRRTQERKGKREEGEFWRKPREEEKPSRRTIEEEKRSRSGDRQKLGKEFCG